MQESATFALFAILCCALFGECWTWTTSRPEYPPHSGVPVVVVTQDIERHLLTISGPAWGTGKPQVRLGAEDLPVERYTANEIVARLPEGIKPDVYVLTVATGDDIRRHDTLLYSSGS
jgi:hypothetical protein